MKFKFPFLIACSFLTGLISHSQTVQQKVNQYRKENESKIIDEYVKFVTIPNVTRDTANILRNAAFIKMMMEQRGIKAEFLNGTTPNVNPVVFGEIKVPGAKYTLSFYAHYDGQPVNPAKWTGGLQPFEPVFIDKPVEQGGKIILVSRNISPEYRLAGRGSADDKAGVMTILNAYDALVKTGVVLKHNIKFFFEGEEELGSTHLDEIFKKNKEKLQTDLWVIIDGPRHVSGKKMISFGVRGDVNMNLTVYGLKRPLHSGNYGNWAPNPAMRLAHLLASMKDKNGMVTIKGFYDDVIPLSPLEKQALQKIPDVEKILKEELAITVPDGGGRSFLELINMPTLNINGMQSANVGSQATNIIPATATAVLDLRLVHGNDVDRQLEKLGRHIKEQGYFITDKEPTDEERNKYPLIAKLQLTGFGYNAQRTPMDLPVAARVIKAVQATSKDEVVLMPTLGGSLPLFLFEKHLGAKPVTITIVNYDNNQHAENENVMIRYIWEGIETIAAVMLMK